MLRHLPALIVLVLLVGDTASASATWGSASHTITISPSLVMRGAAGEASVDLQLNHDTPCTITIAEPTAGSATLSCGTDTLTTQYKLTGASLDNPDTTWVSADQFIQRSYTISNTGPSSTLTLSTRAVTATDRANDAGTYEANITLTATW